MRHLRKIAVLACILSFGSCTVEDTAINDELLEVVADDGTNKDPDPEPEPNN